MINQSSLVGKAEKYTHYGNYLQVSDKSVILAKTNGGQITAATYNNPVSGGRVLVSSSNYWLDNIGIAGGYVGANINNKIFAENTLKWLNQDKRIVRTGQTITPNEISGNFVVFQDSIPSLEAPSLYIESNKWNNHQAITPINHGNGNYSFSHSFTGEGIFRITASFGEDYIVWELIVDSQGPSISPHPSNPNGTVFEETSFYLLEFIVADDISGVNPNKFEVLLDDLVVDSDITYRDETNLLIVLIRADNIPDKEAGALYKLKITSQDKNGNSGDLFYYFQIGTPPISTSSSVTSSSSTSTDKKSDDSNLLLDNIEFIIFIGLTSVILILTYKNYQLRKTSK